MGAHVSLLAIVALPLLAGLLIAAFAPAWRRWFGAEWALALAGRIALGATLLSGLLVAAAVYALRVRPDLDPSQPVPWAGAGRTTALSLDLELGGLALAVVGVSLVIALAVQLAALGDLRSGARTLGRSALLLSGTLLLALAATVWGAALGWQIVALVVASGGAATRGDMAVGTDQPDGAAVVKDMSFGAGPSGHVLQDMPRPPGAAWDRLADAGVWLAVLVTAVGAGDLGLALISRGALLGEHASLLVGRLGGPFGGVAPATVAALGLVVAVLVRIAGLPAALRGEAPAARAALLALASGAGVLLLLRLHVLLTLAPTVMAALTLLAGLLAAAAAIAGLRAQHSEEALTRVAQAQLGLLLVAVGLGAWAPACGLLLGSMLASGGLALGLAADGRGARLVAALALAGVLPATALWAGEIGGAALLYMSVWSPAVNFVGVGLVAITALAIAGSMGHVLRDRSVGAGGAEVGLAAGLLALAAVGVAAIDVPGSLTALRVVIGPEFAASWMLPGDYALGPRPGYSVALARWGACGWLLLALVGVAAAPRLRSWAARLPTPRWPAPALARPVRALVVALHELGELRVLRALFLAPVGPGVARAPGPVDPQRGLVLALFGALAVLGVVYCNPDVAQLGPSRAYPVDVGGLNPALLGTRRSPTKPAAAEAQPVPAEPGPTPGRGDARGPDSASGLSPGTGAPGLSPGTGTPGLPPGAGATGMHPETGAPGLPSGAGATGMHPETGAPGLSPGTGAPELSPGTGAPELSPGTGTPGLPPMPSPLPGPGEPAASTLSRETGDPAGGPR